MIFLPRFFGIAFDLFQCGDGKTSAEGFWHCSRNSEGNRHVPFYPCYPYPDSMPALSIPAPQQPRAGHVLHGSAVKASSRDHRDACVPDFHLLHKHQGPAYQGCKTDFSETLRHCEGEQAVIQL